MPVAVQPIPAIPLPSPSPRGHAPSRCLPLLPARRGMSRLCGTSSSAPYEHGSINTNYFNNNLIIIIYNKGWHEMEEWYEGLYPDGRRGR